MEQVILVSPDMNKDHLDWEFDLEDSNGAKEITVGRTQFNLEPSASGKVDAGGVIAAQSHFTVRNLVVGAECE
jgi:hypothetical protein